MTVVCKLWLLAVVCVAFLYQDGPQGNGVSCVKKPNKSDVDKSSRAASSDEDSDVHDDDDEDQNSDNQSGSFKSGDDSHSGSAGNDNDVSSGEKDDDGDDGNDDDNNNNNNNNDDDDDDDDNKKKVSNHDKDKYRKKLKTKHETHKKSVKDKNHQGHNDDHDDEDHEDLEIYLTTTIKGKRKDILRFLNTDVKPYEPPTLDFSKESNSKLLKRVEGIIESSKSSKDKKESKVDLEQYIENITKESSIKNLKNINSKELSKILAKTIFEVIKKYSLRSE